MHNSGGMERVLSVCANALCQVFDVSIITIYQKGRQFCFSLNESILCYDLGLNNVTNKKLLKERLMESLLSHHFDVVVSMGGIDMYYLHSIKDGSKKIVWFHFAIDIAKTTWIGPNPNLKQKIKAQLQTWKRIHHAKKYEAIVVISNADLHAWKKYTDKALLIYNPVTITFSQKSNRTSKMVISVGRLDFQKGYDYLIRAWNIVVQKHSDWHLNIYGDGTLKDILQKQINETCLSNSITLCGRTSNIEEKYALHSIYVMSSRAEGFPLALLEASFCSLPLISYNCPSGPSEIIENGQNGLLIEHVGDVKGMAEAICTLIENEHLRNVMGDNALKTVEKFSLQFISNKWIELLNKI